MHDLDQILLRRHHRVDRLVGSRGLVDHVGVLAAFDVCGGLDVVVERDQLLRGGAAHHPAGAVAAAAEAVLVAEAAHDEALRAHAARDDAQFALARAHRALAGHVHVLAEVVLHLHVVVVAVHRLGLGLERLGDDLAHRLDHMTHHDLAVHARVTLRPVDREHVVRVVLAAFRQVREVLVRQVDHPALHLLLRQLDEVGADGVADAARTGVQHEPHALFLVETDLDEMVAGAERAEMVEVVGLLQARVALADLVEIRDQLRPALDRQHRRVLPCALVASATCGAATMRHGALDRAAHFGEVVRQVARHQRGARGDHAAADVHAHRRRDDRADGRHHRTHRRALAQMHVGHHRDPAVDEGQLRDIAQLVAGLVLERDAARPQLDRHRARILDDVVIVVGHGKFSHCRKETATRWAGLCGSDWRRLCSGT